LQIGSLEPVSERGIEAATPPAEDLNDRIVRHVERADNLQEAQATLDDIQWLHRRHYSDAVYESTFMGWMFGHLQIAMQHLGVELASSTWTGLPFAEAIRIFILKDIVPRSEFDRLQEAHKTRAWTIAGDHSSYTLLRTHESLTLAIADGDSIQKWVTESAERFKAWGVNSLGDHHLRTVFNTSTLGSYQAGRYQQSKTPEMINRRPFWRYRTVGDERVRESHAAMDGAVYPANHSIWATWYPPNGFNCRCRVEPIREEDAGDVRTDIPDQAPDPGFGSAPSI
jgi:SPP1 gp7 family putative phage head morphogenesis protein